MQYRTTIRDPAVRDALLKQLDARVTLGVPVRVRVEGLRALAAISSYGDRILERSIAVLEERPPQRYWPLHDLLMTDRALAEQCFPDAPSTVPEHMRHAPDWLLASPITEPQCPPS